jgi:diacylglycerol kinase (ATP)
MSMSEPAGHVADAGPSVTSERDHARVAVIYNPIKVSDEFRSRVEDRAARCDWSDPLWLATSEEDPGGGMVRQAVADRVNLVVCAGGDGTVRIVADGLAHSGIPMGIIPAGTGNLLARNLGLPTDEAAAVEVAFGGHTRAVDLIALAVDNRKVEHFAVMAGIGVDAVIMDETDDDLKAKIGAAAYFVAAAKALGRLPIRMTVQLDRRRPVRRRAMVCIIGNVAELRGGLSLIPGARPDDGLLDLYIASPHRFWHWVKLALRTVTRRAKKDDQVDQRSGTQVRIRLHGKQNYQLDGDVVGEGTTLTASIVPGALTVAVEPPAAPADATRPEGKT